MEGMQEIGGLLRAERERQGRSLEEVYRATHITTRYLECIETGEFERTPGEVYLKGFLRRYAAFLGMDGEELVRRYQERRAANEHPPAPEGGSRPGSARGGGGALNRSARLKWVIAGTILAAVVSGWALATWYARTPDQPPSVAGAPEEQASEPAMPPEVPEEPAAPPELAVPLAPVRVNVQLIDRCWFRVVSDGQFVYEGELTTGDQREWTAMNRLSVRFGNPEGVKVTWNGQPVELKTASSVTKLFTKEAILTPPPPPRPSRPAPATAPAAQPAAPVQAPTATVPPAPPAGAGEEAPAPPAPSTP